MSNSTLKDSTLEIVQRISLGEIVDDKWHDKFVRSKNRENHDEKRTVAKRRLMPEYLRLIKDEKTLLEKYGWNKSVDKKIKTLLQAKPRRTASGVATITVLTKPWPCSGECVFCPSDIRMPKSYLHNEPACQRAERWGFDPYLQVTSRLTVIADMGHNIDKIELIILGGTFTDYSQDYQRWFVCECFRACNDFEFGKINLSLLPQPVAPDVSKIQERINCGELTYNDAFQVIWGKENSDTQSKTWEDLVFEQKRNETASSRIVGLVVETRPDKASVNHLASLRKLGCTKIQIGIQTLDQQILDNCCRGTDLLQIKEALANLRLFGFKSHVHIMANLPGATADGDIKVYEELMTDENFMPDEVKVYPCCLVESAKLTEFYKSGKWTPYSEDELVSIMIANIKATPPWCRISRMIRDISTTDIIAGNKKPNLRQLVENSLSDISDIQEMRVREIAEGEVVEEDLHLSDVVYETSISQEHFLQFTTSTNKLCAFLRLSFPKKAIVDELKDSAIIREVHVYGKVAKIGDSSNSAQHLGLGTRLIDSAITLSCEAGFKKLQVISAVGTKEYYRDREFQDGNLYLYRDLTNSQVLSEHDL